MSIETTNISDSLAEYFTDKQINTSSAQEQQTNVQYIIISSDITNQKSLAIKIFQYFWHIVKFLMNLCIQTTGIFIK